MNRYNIFLQELYRIFLLKKIIYISYLIFLIYLTQNLFDYIIYCNYYPFSKLDFNNTIYCMDNNNENWRNIHISTNLGTIFDIGINVGISYLAYKGAIYTSSNLALAPLLVKIGVFISINAVIYIIRSLFSIDPILNLNINLGDFNNNNDGNRFNSPLEYGEILNNFNIFIDSMIGLNLIILMMFNILVFLLFNRTIMPYILKWLENKLGIKNLIYKIIERTYRANMKISIGLIIYIIIILYIFMLFDLWGLTRIRLAIIFIIENIDNIFPKSINNI